jgi:hypothetical protein
MRFHVIMPLSFSILVLIAPVAQAEATVCTSPDPKFARYDPVACVEVADAKNMYDLVQQDNYDAYKAGRNKALSCVTVKPGQTITLGEAYENATVYAVKFHASFGDVDGFLPGMFICQK